MACGKVDTRGAFLALCLAISTIPVVIAGLAIKMTGIDEILRSVAVIGWTMLEVWLGTVLGGYDGVRMKTTDQSWSLKDAVVMGLCASARPDPWDITLRHHDHRQPAGLGYGREGAAKLSMLMSIPTILASGALLSLDVVGNANWSLARDALIAASFAFVAALLALTLMMRLLRSVSFTPT